MFLFARYFALCSFFLLPASLTAAERVRVETVDSVPQIRVDGVPVRARMFFGQPGTRPFEIGREAQRISYEFQPLESDPGAATMHFRFGRKPATIFLDDIRIKEIETDRNVLGPCDFENGMDDFNKDWNFWPQDAANTVGKIDIQPGVGANDSSALAVRLTAPENEVWPDFHIFHHPTLAFDKTKKYCVSFWAKSDTPTDIRIGFYQPQQKFRFLGGGPDFYRSQIELAAAAGASFVSFPIGLPWPAIGKNVDWEKVDRSCEQVLAANPNALLIPRIPMDPPAWWMEANPDDVIQWQGTPSKARRVAAVSSLKYRQEAAERLADTIRYFEDHFAPNMGGYHPVGQNTGEWFYQDSWGPALNGYSESDRVAWRAWLLKRYENNAALQKAWGNETVSLSTVEVPSPELRSSVSGGVFRDTAVEKSQRAVLDFVEFQQEMMADTVLAFAKTTRNASGGKRLVVFFYGYVFEFGSLSTGPATSGHYALRKVLDSPDIDILCSPISYQDRKLGGSGAAMTAAESIALAGKLWLYENDTRTHLTPKAQYTFPGWPDGGDTPEETRQLLLRDTAQCALRNFGTWWMDLGAAGWFDDPALWNEMKRLEKLDDLFLKTPTPYRPEIAALIDARSMLAVAFRGNAMSRPAIAAVRQPLARTGAPYGQYLLDDFLDGKIDAKLNVFLNPWMLSDSERTLLKERCDGKVNIWCYAPGFLDEEKGGSLETMRDLIGFTLKRVENVKAQSRPTELGRELGLCAPIGTEQTISPLFAVADAKPEETLAVYSDGSAAVVMRQIGETGWSFFVGPPGLNSSLLRLAARKAGVHLYTKKDCNVYANGSVVVLHGSDSESVDVDFGRSGKIVDLLGGRELGHGPSLTVPLKKGETRVLSIE